MRAAAADGAAGNLARALGRDAVADGHGRRVNNDASGRRGRQLGGCHGAASDAVGCGANRILRAAVTVVVAAEVVALVVFLPLHQ